MKIVTLLLISIFWLGCEPSVNTQSIEVTFDHTCLLIPKKYFLSDLPPTLVPSQGLDKNIGVLLDIPLPDLGYHIKKKIGYRYELTVLMTPLKIQNSSTPTLPPIAIQAWKSSGLYEDRIIEFDKITQLYRVYSSEHRVMWDFFKSYPKNSGVPEEEWVAGCLRGPLEEEAPDLSNVTCKTEFLYQDIHIQMTLSGMYINSIEELKDRVKKLFSQWEVQKSSESKK